VFYFCREGRGKFDFTFYRLVRFKIKVSFFPPSPTERSAVIQRLFKLERVKELLAQEPGLLNATWDWGGGDFETALGGAGHMGRKDIAEFLINKGSRMDIFVATMLGKLDVVKAMLTAYPELIASKGPHGLTFLHHARKGGEAAVPLLQYLESLGAS